MPWSADSDQAATDGAPLTNSRRVTCPVCGRLFDTAQARSMPFCSSRCRHIDLYRWLNEDYGLPYEQEAEVPDDA